MDWAIVPSLEMTGDQGLPCACEELAVREIEEFLKRQIGYGNVTGGVKDEIGDTPAIDAAGQILCGSGKKL